MAEGLHATLTGDFQSGVICMTPRKGIFHIETIETQCESVCF